MAKNTTGRTPKLPESNAAVARMNDALLGEYHEIMPLLVAADRHDVEARYNIAVHCLDVREGDGRGGKYGERAVAMLTKALGWKKSTLYDYANVAKAWPDKRKFDELAAQDDTYGKPLSWSHIVLLATVATPEHCDKLAKDALKHGWNVRELRKKLHLDTAGSVEADSTAVPPPQAAPRPGRRYPELCDAGGRSED